MSTGPKVQKSVTKQVKTTTRYEFTHAEVCKRLRLPGSALLAIVPADGVPCPIDVEEKLVAEVTTESSK
jgi:hypothetical protein